MSRPYSGGVIAIGLALLYSYGGGRLTRHEIDSVPLTHDVPDQLAGLGIGHVANTIIHAEQEAWPWLAPPGIDVPVPAVALVDIVRLRGGSRSLDAHLVAFLADIVAFRRLALDDQLAVVVRDVFDGDLGVGLAAQAGDGPPKRIQQRHSRLSSGSSLRTTLIAAPHFVHVP